MMRWKSPSRRISESRPVGSDQWRWSLPGHFQTLAISGSGLARRTYPVIRIGALPLNYELLEKEAHAIKGSSGTFGARKLKRMAVELEEACRSGRSDEIGSLVSSMQDLGLDTMAALNDHFGIGAG